MTTPSQFFANNLKWIVIILGVLLLFSRIQGCNKNMKLNMTSGEYIQQIDSLEKRYNIYYKESQDSIKKLNFKLQLANEHAKMSDERAKAIESAVSKIRANTTTTVVVRGAEEIKDTILKK